MPLRPKLPDSFLITAALEKGYIWVRLNDFSINPASSMIFLASHQRSEIYCKQAFIGAKIEAVEIARKKYYFLASKKELRVNKILLSIH